MPFNSIILPNLSTLTGIQVSLIISPVMARSILLDGVYSTLFMMGVETLLLMQKHCFLLKLTVL